MSNQTEEKEVTVTDFEQCSTREKVARWENVVRVLRGLTRHQRKKHWDMSDLLQQTSCGTVGCAAGWCSLDPWFRRRGIKSNPIKNDRGEVVDWDYDGIDWTEFWGTGHWAIFQNLKRRPVGEVIREIKAHIKEIRNGTE